jgi:hypothetical protein
MTECQRNIATWEQSVEYYRERLRRCDVTTEPSIRVQIALAQAVLDALNAFNADYLARISAQNA